MLAALNAGIAWAFCGEQIVGASAAPAMLKETAQAADRMNQNILDTRRRRCAGAFGGASNSRRAGYGS